MINPHFDMSPAARRAICDAALARYLPRAVEAPVKVAVTELRKAAKDTLERKTAREKRLLERFQSKRDPRIGEVVQVPYVTTMTIVDRVREFGRDWYVLEATLIEHMTLHKLVGTI